MIAQAIGAGACLVYVSTVSVAVYKLIEMLVGNRVGKEIEHDGLDIPEMGVAGYSGAVMDKASESPTSR